MRWNPFVLHVRVTFVKCVVAFSMQLHPGQIFFMPFTLYLSFKNYIAEQNTQQQGYMKSMLELREQNVRVMKKQSMVDFKRQRMKKTSENKRESKE